MFLQKGSVANAHMHFKSILAAAVETTTAMIRYDKIVSFQVVTISSFRVSATRRVAESHQI